MEDYLTYNDVGCKVKTKYGIGVLICFTAGAGFWVEPLDENEEWEDIIFEGKDLEKII